MIPALVIVFHRVEGYTHECRPVTFTGPDCWEDVERHIFRIRHTAPVGGAYDKCDVIITFAHDDRGEPWTYRTRYDLTRDGTMGLADHVRREWAFYAGRWCHGRMTPERHAAFLVAMEVDTAAWAHRCDAYQVPGWSVEGHTP